MRAEDDPRLLFVPIAQAIIPPRGIIEHLKNNWWVVHPIKGLVFVRYKLTGDHASPVCNQNEEIARRIATEYPWAEVQLIPSVFRRININDYVG